jgi:SAM-dependent methyltransferase
MRLYGYDVTPAMVAYAQRLSTTGARPTFAVHDATTQPLPHADGTVHLVVMTSVLHVMDEPLVVLADIRRVLTPTGLFMLHDWVRQPLSVYLARRQESIQEDPETNQRRGFRLFAVHNKYTTEDWQWLLAEAGFAIRHQAQLRPTHQMFVATPAAP